MSNEIIKKTELHNGNVELNSKLNQINKVNVDGKLTDSEVLSLLNLSDEEFNKEILKRCNDVIRQIEEFKNSLNK